MVDRRAGLNIGVDSTTGAVLAGTQARQLLEPDDNLTIRLPPLFMDVVGQVPRESARCGVRVGAYFLEVVHTEGNDVFVWGQKAISLQLLNTVTSFATQQGFDLLGNYRSSEYPRKRVIYRRFELALDSRDQPPLATHALAVACTCLGMSPAHGKRSAHLSYHSSMVSARRDAAALSEL